VRDRSRRQWRAIALTAVIAAAAAVLAVIVLSRRAAPTDPLRLAVEEHLPSGAGRAIRSADGAGVPAWLNERLALAVQVPVLARARRPGAHITFAGSLHGASIEYATVDGGSVERPVSYLVLPQKDGMSGGNAVSASGLTHLARDGFHIVAWREPGL